MLKLCNNQPLFDFFTDRILAFAVAEGPLFLSYDTVVSHLIFETKQSKCSAEGVMVTIFYNRLLVDERYSRIRRGSFQ